MNSGVHYHYFCTTTNLGNIHYLAGRLEKAADTYETALTLYHRLDNEAGAALVCGQRCRR